MMKFLEWNIQDRNLLWLIRKYLKAGIMEQGKFEPTEEGSAQGSAMSPMLANIYTVSYTHLDVYKRQTWSSFDHLVR